MSDTRQKYETGVHDVDTGCFLSQKFQSFNEIQSVSNKLGAKPFVYQFNWCP